MFAVVCRPLPDGAQRDRAVAQFSSLTHALAMKRLLLTKALLDGYAGTRLDDAVTLEAAVSDVAQDLDVHGDAAGVLQRAGPSGDHAVAYVVGDVRRVTSTLLQTPQLSRVRTSYRRVMHRQARDLMSRRQWDDALALWHHLHARGLVSQALYLDAAHCFIASDRTGEAERVLGEALDAFADAGAVEFFERAGDLAMKCKSSEADRIARRAFERASAGLLSNTTVATTTTTTPTKSTTRPAGGSPEAARD